MREIGARIYYDKWTGEVILHIGERKGMVTETTLSQDVRSYKVLFERNQETYDFIDLEYGQYRQDFRESNGYRVNPETKELEFSYPDPNEPPNEQEVVYGKPLSEQINELEGKTDQAIMELTMVLAMGGTN